jgi:hypothetical protein
MGQEKSRLLYVDPSGSREMQLLMWTGFLIAKPSTASLEKRIIA